MKTENRGGKRLNAGRKPDPLGKKKQITLYAREALRTEKVKGLLEFTLDHLIVCLKDFRERNTLLFRKGEVYQYFNREEGAMAVITKNGKSILFDYHEGNNYFSQLIN